MATYTRTNAWNEGGTFDNEALLWYARGVGEMQSRALSDPNSWWFFAAIHGEYITTGDTEYPGWAYIPPMPNVPTSPLPSQSDIDAFWNQCQHQSWFFPPWHRGYLVALEDQVRAAVKALGGPSTWALPFWDYLGPDEQYTMPPAFAQETLPDGSPNPLFVTARYGPQNDGDIFVEIPPVSDAVMGNDIYSGSNAKTPRPGFGGPTTGFSHNGSSNGNLESNPHNLVHVDVGGQNPKNRDYGLMADPGTAALDPIFYLHHCNIDRMWAFWNADGNTNPTSPPWLAGPAATGEREFIMPKPDNPRWVFTPDDVNNLDKLDYTYEGLDAERAPARNELTRRFARLGLARPEVAPTAMTDEAKNSSELVGAHDGTLTIRSKGVRASVKLDQAIQKKVTRSFAAASLESAPDRAYLQLENVRGTRDANKLHVYVNGVAAGCVALFGLRRASRKDGQHGGAGLSLELDITEVIDSLHLDNALDVDSLDIRVVPSNAIPEGDEITVGRVSIHREGSA